MSFFELITNDGKLDSMLIADNLLRDRLSEIYNHHDEVMMKPATKSAYKYVEKKFEELYIDSDDDIDDSVMVES